MSRPSSAEPLETSLGSPTNTSEPRPTVTPRQLTMNIVCGGLGTGMFSLPSSVAGSSLIPCVLVLVLTILLNAWTTMILVQAAEYHQTFDIGGLIGLLPMKVFGGRLRVGSLAQACVNVLVFVVCMISLISYLIVIDDAIHPFVQDIVGSGRAPVVTAAAAAMVPLCFLEQHHLSWTSFVALLVNIYIIALVSILFVERYQQDLLPDQTCWLGAGRGLISMLAVFGQCFVSQMCILPMYEELEDRSPRMFNRCLCSAFTLLGLIFGTFACLGYLLFGAHVEGNAMDNFPKTISGHLASLGSVLVAMALYPIMVIPMVAPVKHLHVSLRFRKLLFPVTIFLIVLTSYVFALIVPNLLTANLIGGALCVAVFASVVPGIVGLCLLRKHGLIWKFLMALLILFGLANGVFGLTFVSNYVEDLLENCLLPVKY